MKFFSLGHHEGKARNTILSVLADKDRIGKHRIFLHRLTFLLNYKLQKVSVKCHFQC